TKNNVDCYKVSERGNDAPRGGKVGDFVVVEFTPVFFEKYGWFFEEKKRREEAAKIAAEKRVEIEKEITEKFAEYVKKHPENVEKWESEMELLSSKKCRLYKENRVARATGNFEFWGKYRIYDKVIK
ncbi:hypothetical protein LJC11_05075, partial [Bacteroidales bacterium OttesenSCG-928-I21]|nr:hypothetical protein [Bacteroidales bacterium OttesenSCG-928-I21]